MPPSRNYDKNDPEAIAARDRVIKIIDSVPPEKLVSAIKQAPSLRGIILGYIAEQMFEDFLIHKHLINPENIETHDDHDRRFNKSDRTIRVDNRLYRVQLKSIQTNSITRNVSTGALQATVQNDASDSRRVILPSGRDIVTTCYVRGDYDVLAVPLFPFAESWDFAFKRNLDCRQTNSTKYREEDAAYLLATTEVITWPLSDDWSTDLLSFFDQKIGLLA